MTSETDTIDFMPVEISKITECDGYISVFMPNQPCYTQRIKDDVPEYSCEIRIYGGTIEAMNVSLPYTGELDGVKYNDGWRGCFLPFDFMAEGPVVLSFCDKDGDKPQIVIKGKSLSLKVLDKV